jgi:zinc protease
MKSRLSILLFIINILFAVVLLSQTETKFAFDQPLASDPKITIGTLNNGLKYYIRRNKKPEKRAELRLVVKAGSVLEDDDQQGLAHFVEHMAFNGTASYPKQEIINFLERSGMRFGPEINAYTSFDETVYMLEVPTDSPEVVKKGFQILEEWGHAISFNDSEIEKERGVVIEEWRLYRGADYRVAMKHIPLELYKSRYAERIVIGKKETLESCSPDLLRKYYHEWYRPDLMALFAVGDFDKKEIEELVVEHFSKLENPKQERQRLQYPIPDHQETLVSIVTDPELTRSSIEVIFKREIQETHTAGAYRNNIIGNLYNAMFNTRLRELLQQSNPPFLYAYCSDARFIGEKQSYNIGVGVKENEVLNGFEVAITEAERVRQHGFTYTELERQKVQFLRGLERAYLEREKTESRQFIDEYTRNFLEREPIPGIEIELALFRQFLPGISIEEVNKLTAERMTLGNRVITVSLPKKGSVIVPTEAEVLAIMNNTRTQKLTPYIDKVSEQPLITTLPPPGSITSEKKIKSLGVTEWKLSNGARVVMKPTDYKNDEILFSSFSFGGTSVIPDSNYISAAFATAIIGQSGIGNFDAIALQKKLTGKIANVSPAINQLGESLGGSAAPQDLETLFQLIYLYGTSPRKDTTAFSSLITRYKAMLQNRSVSPDAAFSDTLQVTISNYHFRSRPVSIPMMDEIHLDLALNVYKERFADFSDFTFFFVGNFQVDSLKPFVKQFLASLPSTKRKETWRDVGIIPPKGIVSKKVFKGIEPKSTINITFTGPFVWTQQNRYTFNAMLEALNIKLREVLREDKGGTYGVRASGSPSQIPRQEYNITISWGCNPERVDELVSEAFLQIDSLKQKILDPIYIEKVREIQRRSHEVNLKQNGFWINNLRIYYSNNEDPEMILNYPKLVENLKADAIRKAIQQYFDMNNYVKVVLYPEKKE